MLRIAQSLLILFMLMPEVGLAYDSLVVEPGSGGQSDQMVATATEHALIERGCETKVYGATERSGRSKETLVLRFTPIAIDQARSRFSGYGVQLDSILWTASVRAQLIDSESQKILASIDESAEERQIPSLNGNQEWGDLMRESQSVGLLIGKIGSQSAVKLEGTLKDHGICRPANHVKPLQALSTSKHESEPVEAKKPLTSAIQTSSPSTLLEPTPKEPKEKNLAKVVENDPVASGKGAYRVALVIGNTHYKHIPTLNNPSNDARFVGEKIVASGFELVGGAPLLDLTKPKLEKAIADFGQRLSQQAGAVGFFYYAGHGVQVNGVNYLVPVDANPSRIADLARQAIEVDSLLQEMEDSRTGLNIIVLDACRNNPFGGRGIRESGAGLAQMRAPKGSIIVYATQPGNIAQDGPSGQNSPFAKALAHALSESDLDLFGTFNEVGLLVANATGGEQQPWMSSSPISGRFCFKGCPE